jgi:hypothetical protein
MLSKTRSDALVEAALLPRDCASECASHHRRQRQRDHRGDDDGDRQRDGELAEEAADNVAHEEQRNQHGDQRDGQREMVKPICSAPLSAACIGDRPLRDSARCSRSSRWRRRPRSRWRWSAPSATGCRGCSPAYIAREGADQRQRHRHAGNDGGVEVAQEEKDDHHDQAMVSISSNSTSEPRP